MLKNSTTEIPYSNIDYEIRDLIRYINDVDGIETTECCCGHEEMPCLIYFKADSIECVTKFISKYLYRDRNWRITINLTDSEIGNSEWNNPTYLLEGTISDYHYVGLAIDNLTKEMYIKQNETKAKI